MKLSKQSALDLHLKGTVGSFKIGNNVKTASFEVKYLLTHVGLNFELGNDEKLLKELAPVREIFDFRSLDFDEIMQRDIDDSRVTGELIPYILDNSTSDLVKFFPPIVVVALPTSGNANKPADFYPSTSQREVKRHSDLSGVDDWWEVQAGADGQEVFKFEQPIVDGETQLHDLVNLHINTSKCKLVIVDGQHRAMALLALYRNLKDDWTNARRKPFESYYKEWTPDYIRSFSLEEIKLPMIICTIPGLDENYKNTSGEYDLKKASRSIFLTLNKNARKVSRTRNLLLDDSDLISSFMRRLLSKVKNGDSDFANNHSMEIHNVELDQSGDRQVISSPMAYTGVSHLYYIIEHILLDNDNIKGIKKRDGRFSTRTNGTYFENALNRLDCENILGAEAYHNISRNLFSRSDELKLGEVFLDRYGKFILTILSSFEPYDVYAIASQFIKNISENHADVHLKPMLFDGQGISKVFEEHRSALQLKLKEGFFKHEVPKIQSFKDSLDNTYLSYKGTVEEFDVSLTEEYLNSLPNKSYKIKQDDNEIISPVAINLVSKLYKNIFTTIAFQAALTCGFFVEYEKHSSTFDGDLDLVVEDVFKEYLEQINMFFRPKTFAKFRSMVSLLIGEATGDDICALEVVDNSASSFRAVVYPGEMAPDEWPKYMYLILEIWKPSNEELEKRIEKTREACREQIFENLFKRRLEQFCKDNNKKTGDASHEEIKRIVEESFDIYKGLLKNLQKPSILASKIKAKIISGLNTLTSQD
tara:strand:+ start:780 stop:3059 length:2280 start_codon:yes stop_codon:yes gene_type:complete